MKFVTEEVWLAEQRERIDADRIRIRAETRLQWKQAAYKFGTAAAGTVLAGLLANRFSPHTSLGWPLGLLAGGLTLSYGLRFLWVGLLGAEKEVKNKLAIQREVVLAKQIEILQARGVIRLPPLQTPDGMKTIMPFNYFSPGRNNNVCSRPRPSTQSDLDDMTQELIAKLRKIDPVLSGAKNIPMKSLFTSGRYFFKPLAQFETNGFLSFAPGREPTARVDKNGVTRNVLML